MNVPNQDPIARFSQALGNFVPDAISASVILLAVVVAAALAIGNPPATVVDAYYRGLWMLLPFTMQMTLILVLSAVVSSTPLFRTGGRRAGGSANHTRTGSGAGRWARRRRWVPLLGPRRRAGAHHRDSLQRRRRAEENPGRLPVPPCGRLGGHRVWQFGLSSSPALLMATPGHFLDATVGVLSFRSTIWSLPAVLMVLTFPVGVVLLTIALMPKAVQPLSAFPEAQAVAATRDADAAVSQSATGPAGFAAWVERSWLVPATLAVCLVLWLYHHFVTKGHSLDLNAMNTALLLIALLLHRNVVSFSKAIQHSVQVCWPILVLYHLYGGVAGLLQYTTVGEGFAGLFASVATPLTFPLLTAIGSTVVAVFVPSSGGQWVVQGFVTAKAAAAVGSTVQRGLLAVGVGDQMGNLMSPFWPVLTAGIARVDFRVFFGYLVIFSLLWFTLGVAILTFVP